MPCGVLKRIHIYITSPRRKSQKHLNALRGIETFARIDIPVNNHQQGQKHLNALRGIETSSLLRDRASLNSSQKHLNALRGIETVYLVIPLPPV